MSQISEPAKEWIQQQKARIRMHRQKEAEHFIAMICDDEDAISPVYSETEILSPLRPKEPRE
ncbi:hypothetical protein ACFL6U_29235 [Planctomycetota bacterium]